MPKKKAAAKKKKSSRKKSVSKAARKSARGRVSGKKATKKRATKKKRAGKKASKKKKKKKKKAVAKKSAKKSNRKAKKKSAKKSTKKSPRKAAKKAGRKASKTKPGRKVAKKKAVTRKKAGAKKAKSTKRTASQGRTAARVPSKKNAAQAARRRISRAALLTGPVRGFEPYHRARTEDYMNAAQLEHFRQILLAWKRELMEEVDRTMHHMKDDAANPPDPADRATQETEFGLELRTRDRERKLLKKIDSALGRIDDGSYGYCEETGEEIGLRRLEARPVATLCVEAQERRELAERQFRDREDYYR